MQVDRVNDTPGGPAGPNGRIPTMITTIDGAGRVVIPKALRSEMQLSAGTELEMRVRGGILEIEPVSTPMRLVRRGKGLVASPDKPLPPLGPEDVRAVTESRRR